ncbi:ABC transporter permease [Bradyrhizobium manausense]|uniref:ABC transporter permease n=1 Tax=Bradyrhizobium manausense TaxID=989370 RepID=UPI001BABDAE5|nr:ABC transporter permease [Bradyrhizobium manausense]MBR0725518.1 ABC transporter permease [Bradyrhizobium manausense]
MSVASLSGSFEREGRLSSVVPDIVDQPVRRRTEVFRRLIVNRQAIALPAMFVVASVVFTLGSPNFGTLNNLTNVARQSVYLLIISLGQLIVIVGGGLDLSVGSVVSLTSVASAMMSVVFAACPDTPLLALAAGLGTGVLIGALVGTINGVGVSVFRIAPFMMTLGISSVLFGTTLLVSGGVPVYGMPPLLGEIFGFGRLAGFPVPAIVALLLVAVTYIVLEWTRFGRYLYATGGNARAAELSGVRTHRVCIAAFMLSGVLAAISGLLLTARLGTGGANVGASMPLDSIAACVISGVSLSGGQGRTLTVVLGTLLIIIVQNGLNLMQVGAYAQSIATGGILILAMALARR